MHTDATPGNILFNNDLLTALIDFELIPGTFLFDLSLSAIRWAGRFDPNTKTNRLDSAWLTDFFRAYNKARLFTDAEKPVIKDVLLLAATWSWGRQRPHRIDDPAWRLSSRGEIYIDICDLNAETLTD
jgi:Ser/Thr protein kinase RdoA (MazF antagonist)